MNPPPSEIWAKEIAQRIRNKVADLNDELTLAALAELDVEFAVSYPLPKHSGGATELSVWCSQEVR